MPSAAGLPQTPPAPIGPVFTDAVAKLVPSEISLETFNSQYLQRHSTQPRAVLAAAKALRILQSPLAEIEEAVFALFAESVKLVVTVSFQLASSPNIDL